MDRSKVERARDYLRELISEGRLDQFALGHVGLVSRLLTTALDDPAASDPCDECECEGCRAKVAEDELAEAFPTEPTSEDFGPCGPLEIKPVQFTFHNDQPSDYEIRLKAWNIAYSFEYADDCQFSATLAAATKLYNFLSGQNGDVK